MSNIQNQVPKWSFDIVTPGVSERNPVGSEFFTQETQVEAIIREAIQNSLDARVDKTKPVEVCIYFSGETGKLPAAEFAEYWNGGEDRFNHPKNGLIRPIPSEKDDCIFFVVEDFNTTGLTGIVDEKPYDEIVNNQNDWNYYNYFFKDNLSDKLGSNALGSWGTGKCVFQRASRLKTSFAYSVRDGFEPRKLLVGKATLKTHQDEKRVTWAPDGWFGLKVEEDELHHGKIPKLPISDESFLARFKERFNLQRVDEPGTSIVIPYLNVTDSDINSKYLIRVVLENFLLTIQNNELSVRVKVGKNGPEAKIDKETFLQFQGFLAKPEDSSALITPLHVELMVQALTGKCQQFNLKTPEQTPCKFSLSMFEEGQLESLKEAYYDEKPILLTVPLVIHKKLEDGTREEERASFNVAIKHVVLPKKIAPAFYRAGLLIRKAATTKHNSCISIVMINRDALAGLLVTAEEPSHSNWSPGAERLEDSHEYGKYVIQFVTGIIKKTLDAMDTCNKEVAFDPLAGFFSIPKHHSLEKPKHKGQPSGAPGGNNSGGVPKLSPKEKIVDFHKVEDSEKGVYGIKILSGPGFQNINIEKFPVQVKFKVGYDTFRGISYSPHDFVIGEKRVKIASVTGPIAIQATENIVNITISKKEAFSFEIIGFDPNRDLSVDKRMYTYNSGKTNDEEVLNG